ncbi:MAG: hypothetical protein AB2609_18695, partial [Candidatus Thiodiazotropha sp.]
MFLRLSLASALSLTFAATAFAEGDNFNPDISLILDGRYSAFDNESEYELPGFMLGGEAGRG